MELKTTSRTPRKLSDTFVGQLTPKANMTTDELQEGSADTGVVVNCA